MVCAIDSIANPNTKEQKVQIVTKTNAGTSNARMPLAIGALAALVCAFALCLTARAQAAPPLISQTSFSAVSETGATLSASVDPTGTPTNAHFEYTTLAEFETHGFEVAQTAPGAEISIPNLVKGTGSLTASSDVITGASATAGAFGIGQTISPTTGIPAATTITAVEAEPGKETLKLKISKAATANVPAAKLTATGPQPISAVLTGLAATTGYVFRAVAKKTVGEEEAQGPPTTFYTYGPAPTFGPCPNDDLRSGAHGAPGDPGALLPDCRSYELATPLAKNGNNALSANGFSRAAADGSAVTFGSPFGIPGGLGAQSLPFYQASRGTAAWSTAGLLPPASFGELGRFLVGQLPDLSATYATATRFGIPLRTALFELHRDGSAPIQITPYTVFGSGTGGDVTKLGFAGASADASTVVIEAATALAPEESGPPIAGGVPSAPNLYAWDRATGQLHLASVMNTPAKTQALLAKGAWAGPYNWGNDELASGGGTEGGYYLTDEHAVSLDGSLLFTSRSDGHVYQRINPTAEQSLLNPQGECTEAAKACTLDVSASERTPPDPTGHQRAAFQAATADGSKVFFTSSEKLTNDANTGPEQPPAQIGRATLNGEGPATDEDEAFLPVHALGTAVDPEGEYIYWADPSLGTIGRANLKAADPKSTVEPEFIVPGETKAISHPTSESGIYHSAPSTPRYVAVDGKYVYWTNTGPLGEEDVTQIGGPGPVEGGGTIGRAKLDHTKPAEPEFITGASNPQGIAVNATNIYWANAARIQGNRGISRAAIGGDSVNAKLFTPYAELPPYGVALSATDLYFDLNNQNGGYISRVPLSGGAEVGPSIGQAGMRGLAIDSGHLYWATQGEGGAIGRISLTEFAENCPSNPTCEKDFLTPSGTLEGLAVSGTHLYWSVNGETPGNPGNDLYRSEPASGALTDLTPKGSTDNPNGAEVRGVLGTSADGSHVYFAANADLDGAGPAEPGDCSGASFKSNSGECSLYLSHDDEFDFIARLATNSHPESDAVNWLPAPFSTALGTGALTPRSSWVSSEGRTLVFRSVRSLALPYESHGHAQLYRFSMGNGITCLTCVPSGATPVDRPAYTGMFFNALSFPAIRPGIEAAGQVQLRFASADGERVFFETPEALVGYDTDGASGCANVSEGVPSCLDVYEWEAPGTGTCVSGGPAYSPLNRGCLYLISQGSDSGPAFFADASSSGDDVFFFTPAQLVGQDSDELLDVYDARVDGGLTAQNPVSTPPCEAEGCKPASVPPPEFQAPSHFFGPSNPKPAKGCPKGKVKKQGKCVKKQAKKHHKSAGRQHQRANANRRAPR